MKYTYLLILILALLLRVYITYDEGILVLYPWLNFPYLEVLLLAAMFLVNGRQTNGFIVFAFISNYVAGVVIDNGTTWGEKQFFFFTGMAFYFALHLNLIRYFTAINPMWKTDLRNKPRRLILPALWWLIAYIVLFPHLPRIAIVPVFIYSGIYVVLTALAWNLDRVIINKGYYLALMAGVIFFLVSDTLLGFVIFGEISGRPYKFPDMFSAVLTWNLGVFLVFYSLIFIQKQTREK